jgi:hypothetical protein
MSDYYEAFLGVTAKVLDAATVIRGTYLDPETKVRHVRDADFWGMPVGTPIVAGMKPKASVVSNAPHVVSMAAPRSSSRATSVPRGLKLSETVWKGWEVAKYRGQEYHVGKEGRNWYVLGGPDWDSEIGEYKSKDEALAAIPKLAKHGDPDTLVKFARGKARAQAAIEEFKKKHPASKYTDITDADMFEAGVTTKLPDGGRAEIRADIVYLGAGRYGPSWNVVAYDKDGKRVQVGAGAVSLGSGHRVVERLKREAAKASQTAKPKPGAKPRTPRTTQGKKPAVSPKKPATPRAKKPAGDSAGDKRFKETITNYTDKELEEWLRDYNKGYIKRATEAQARMAEEQLVKRKAMAASRKPLSAFPADLQKALTSRVRVPSRNGEVMTFRELFILRALQGRRPEPSTVRSPSGRKMAQYELTMDGSNEWMKIPKSVYDNWDDIVGTG